ncbi:MAG: hypothetical protein PHS62_01440 [Patescibacteria group bacterium]|nr:hypothetical protein [Patescibacteria group bacterium]
MANQNKNLGDGLDLAADSGQPIRLDGKEYLNSNGAPKADKEENIVIAKSKIVLAKKLLNNVKENSERLLELLAGSLKAEDEAAISIGQLSDAGFEPVWPAGRSEESAIGEPRTIEGVFDGENMIGPDGKQYSVPANYASKSKLVEGDILKLTITGNGTFVYKQIGPIERARVVGVLERSAASEYLALADGKKWRLLTASVTYYKGDPGDEVVILVPKNGESKWAAVENIVRKQA